MSNKKQPVEEPVLVKPKMQYGCVRKAEVRKETNLRVWKEFVECLEKYTNCFIVDVDELNADQQKKMKLCVEKEFGGRYFGIKNVKYANMYKTLRLF